MTEEQATEKKNLTNAEVMAFQSTITTFAQVCCGFDAELIKRYLEQTRPQLDGTMDVILPRFFSIEQLMKAQRNMRFFHDLAGHILKVQELAHKLQSESTEFCS